MVNHIRSMLRRCKNERGVALLATMLAIALMTLIVVDFTASTALGYLSAANHANEIRAAYLARSAVNVGLALLAQDTRAQKAQAEAGGGGASVPAVPGAGTPPQPVDSYASIWAIPFPPMPLNGGKVELSIVDDARKFNINRLVVTAKPGQPGGAPGQAAAAGQPPALGQAASVGEATAAGNQLAVGQIDPNAVAQLVRLVEILGLDPKIVPPIVDWLDRDSIESPGGAEADYYLRLIPPYEPRNGPMPTLGDLRLIKGIDDATFAKLRKYLTVAPEMVVNVNTVLPEVLACLEPELTQNPRIVDAIMQARSIRPFNNITDVLNVPGVGELQAKLQKDLTTRSDYFTISGMGTYAGARKLVFATFRRNGDGTATLGSWQED